MTKTSKTRDLVAIVGLVVGAVFGIAGSFIGQDALRHLFWTLDGAGIAMAAALLAVKYLQSGHDTLAAGFFVLLAGQALVISGACAGLEEGRASFAGGIVLWSVALVMISSTDTFPRWSRVTGCIAALLFTATAFVIGLGHGVVATSAPLPSAGYPFFVATFAGWILTLVTATRQSIPG